jgi:hypothetical protein
MGSLESPYAHLTDEEMAQLVAERFAFLAAHESESHTPLGWKIQELKWNMRAPFRGFLIVLGIVVVLGIAKNVLGF